MSDFVKQSLAYRDALDEADHAASLARAEFIDECTRWPDVFTDAIAGDFLAQVKIDASLPRERQQELVIKNARAEFAAGALMAMFARLQVGAPINHIERALAEHARDLVQAAAARRFS